jgi:hypothetical protein
LRRSDYLRLASTLDVSTSAGGAVVLDASAFFRMFCELNRWGVNFNQGVRALNTIASRLRKDSLTAEEKAFVASRAKAAASCLEGAEAGLADVHAALCELAGRSHVTIAPRTALRLREGLRCRS